MKSNQSQPKKPLKRLEVSQQDLDKVRKFRQAQEESSAKIDPEWAKLGEAGYYFGWQAIVDILDPENRLTMAELNKLISGAERIWSSHVIDMANATYYGYVSPKTKDPDKTFKNGMSKYYKDLKLDV